MIYTSYYGNLRKIDVDKYVPMSISLSSPVSHISRSLVALLAPSGKLLRDRKDFNISDEEYTERYIKEITLKTPNLVEVLVNLDKLTSKNKEIVLMCYETPDKFCHRHVLADYVNKELGYTLIEELKI